MTGARARAFAISAIVALVSALSPAASAADKGTQVTRGKYLATIGNCAGCHTAPGGPAFAGGRAIESPFGIFFAPNITPDRKTGIGNWSKRDFWQALHDGERPDGSKLYPACPYPNYTHVRRKDIDAIYAYLRSVPARRHKTPAHILEFPYSMRSLLPIWQMLYFEPGVFENNARRSRTWNRGAYLVQGLGHCDACHADRNALGATRTDPNAPGDHVHGWYAPSLHSSREAGLQRGSIREAARLLRTGKTDDTATMGPMADVVFDSLQYLSPDDVRAMATYLHALADRRVEPARHSATLSKARRKALMSTGKTVYEDHCSDCHGASGQGSIAAPPLAGDRTATLGDPTNLANLIRHGGYPPGTTGNPRPFGMRPFPELSDEQVAAVMTFVRASWGNHAKPVVPAELP